MFTPFKHGTRTLLDGALVNPLPIAPTLNDDSDLTIAVNLGGPAEVRPTPLASMPIVNDNVYRAREHALMLHMRESSGPRMNCRLSASMVARRWSASLPVTAFLDSGYFPTTERAPGPQASLARKVLQQGWVQSPMVNDEAQRVSVEPSAHLRFVPPAMPASRQTSRTPTSLT